jgi:hypothetical protein
VKQKKPQNKAHKANPDTKTTINLTAMVETYLAEGSSN